jgi:hypothetical protein
LSNKIQNKPALLAKYRASFSLDDFWLENDQLLPSSLCSGFTDFIFEPKKKVEPNVGVPYFGVSANLLVIEERTVVNLKARFCFNRYDKNSRKIVKLRDNFKKFCISDWFHLWLIASLLKSSFGTRSKATIQAITLLLTDPIDYTSDQFV